MLDALLLKIKLRLINLWPPYLFAGVWVSYPDPHLRTIHVTLRDYFFNRNALGTHFGGSLYSMCDPFYVLILMNALGRDYIVWDKAAEIQFLKPGRASVRAEFQISESEIERIKTVLQTERKTEPVYEASVTYRDGNVIAKVRKTLYVRRRQN